MAHTRAADDFRAIRARMGELRREHERGAYAETDVRSVRLSLREIGSGARISISGLGEFLRTSAKVALAARMGS